uniref:Uncharacterized protein n=1 Tax=Anguilla anguilla TaxID=7936 RepID=A0A0E9V628_ANGAN
MKGKIWHKFHQWISFTLYIPNATCLGTIQAHIQLFVGQKRYFN